MLQALLASKALQILPLLLMVEMRRMLSYYSQITVKSSRQEFARVFSRVPESPCEHAVFQEQSSAPEPRVRQGLLDLCLHPGSETLEFARVASIPDLKSQGIHQ